MLEMMPPCVCSRHHGWLKPIRRPAGCPEVHSNRNDPSYSDHVFDLYPSAGGDSDAECDEIA